ncbi:hypothetical protein CPT_Silvanus_036 [Stenotrophomonas phage Silvanus]|nr:hypothetical protein CPT_Silvanus_036 [Stenotrophomonas phage Silvanus]
MGLGHCDTFMVVVGNRPWRGDGVNSNRGFHSLQQLFSWYSETPSQQRNYRCS